MKKKFRTQSAPDSGSLSSAVDAVPFNAAVSPVGAVASPAMGTAPMVTYHVVASDPAAHLFSVSLVITHPEAEGQCLALPAWIPGSYMVREFARHIVQIRAESNGVPVILEKLDKDTWIADPCSGALVVHYQVYAWDLSVRSAHLDHTHGFFNGTSLFLRVDGQDASPHRMQLIQPKQRACRQWRVATSMTPESVDAAGFGTYLAADYDELVDHPVEMGTFLSLEFEAHGVPHQIAVTGVVPRLDKERLVADIKKICEAEIAFFGDKVADLVPGSKPVRAGKQAVTRYAAPMARYVFLVMVVGDGYGGLEHRASTALVCSRGDLPLLEKPAPEAYGQFLGLCSHEYFHTWNVKRIKPQIFAPYDYQRENYTTLLWLFEGFTSYYDDLFLKRTGLFDARQYFGALAKTINGVLTSAGRMKQTLAESSFDSWGKYYRQDENSPNAIVSYYTKGSLLGLALDLTIRQRTAGKKSLDDVMRALWQRYGRDFYAVPGMPGKGVTEGDVFDLIDEVTGLRLTSFLNRYIHGTDDLPLKQVLATVGVELVDPALAADYKDRPSMGVRLAVANGATRITTVYEGGAAHRAGLAAGDVLVAIDRLKVSGSLESFTDRYRSGDVVCVHAFRRDELLELDMSWQSDTVPKFRLVLKKTVTPAVLKLRNQWLEGK